MKVVENSPQNARNCIIFKKILGGMPPNPHSKGSQLCGMYIQNPRNVKVAPPPPPPPSDTSCIRPCISRTVYVPSGVVIGNSFNKK